MSVSSLRKTSPSLSMSVLKLNVTGFSCIFQRFTWLQMLGSVHAYDLFVEDIEAITDNSDLCDVIIVHGDFNLPKIRWKVDEESGSVLP
jgi:hypothetical protein